ncbi:MAG: NAD-glutamate dehydrogenase [Pseudomonadota bacterium]|nr:NAD-glutamate dehydrogenase [Pseudomonadota bacterium]
MTISAEPQLGDLLQKVIERFHDRLATQEAEGLSEFARRLLERMPPEDLLERSPDQVYGSVLSLWKFARDRKPGQHRLRVYNPKLDEHGWTSRHTVVEAVNDDMPFIVDSVLAALNQLGCHIHLMAHPVIRVLRDGAGRLTGCAPEGDTSGKVESFIQFEVDVRTDKASLEKIEHQLDTVLGDVRAAVDDWPAMMERARAIVEDLKAAPPPLEATEVDEGRALLEWMIADHFTFLGYREYDYLASRDTERLEIVADTGLGVLRNPERRVMDRHGGAPTLSPEVREFLQRPELVIVTKANQRSTIHRPVHFDYIGIKRFDADGNVVGERRFIGLFTSAAYNRTPREIPYLRRKVARVVERSGFDRRGHAGKALVNILDTYPRDELFQTSEDELTATVLSILSLQERPRIRLFIRRDRFERFHSCIVYVPRERYDSELRRKFERILADGLGGRVSAFYTQIGDSALARLHVIISDATGRTQVEHATLEARLIDAARSWEDALSETLIEAHGEELGGQLARRYAVAFSAAYREAFTSGMARIDIDHIEATGPDALGLNLYRVLEDNDDILRLKLFRRGAALALSDVLPMLEHMGLRVLSEQTFTVGDAVAPFCWIHDFRMRLVDGAEIALAEVKPGFEDGFARIFSGEMEDDGFNRLVLRIGLKAPEVVMLRAYCKYLRQAGIAFSQEYMETTLAANPEITGLLVELFHTQFDPDFDGDRDETAATLVESVEVLLNQVESLDQDRILRRYLNAIRSSLRTNYYQPDAAGQRKPYLSIKFDSQALDDLPLPRPLREIFVYSPRVEGVHLRGGLVARGGLRWSDRREDFRTEVLGLVKAQMVKNSVIVPTGSKGGFVPKNLPAGGDREAIQAEGVACYRMFISGLLDLTDNITPTGLVPPARVVRRDQDDPYLVVAADKGTATFSDYANAVAVSYGFWLGDAFASGGAAGYDHKKMGITARGAWECVKRHFREMDHDIQTRPFSAVGVGDMSGDVFGNGMLLSPVTRLIAAFDHRHIFIDPDPDPARSFAERQRMFALPRSSWADYDGSVLSPGAMIIDRKAKRVTLTAEAQAAIGLDSADASPFQVMQAILRADVDLLWFGGIGTYVKASAESHADVGDRANDAIRVNADEIRAKVIGEGANLGITQRARIAYAQHGGRINTDFIDNSAGVDCSDHEVNLKILLGAVEQAGELTRVQRDRLLGEMTDEVGDLVLRDNYVQGQALTVAEAQGRGGLGQAGRLMRAFTRSGLLNRTVEFLPGDDDLLDRTGGLTRPELAVLLSYAKMSLKAELLDSSLPDDPALVDDLVKYFPRPLRKRYEADIRAHRLRREIIATQVANFLVNRTGPTFARLTQDELGVPASEVAQAAMAVREVFDLRPVWNGIDALDNAVPAAVQTRMLSIVQDLMARAATWFLLNWPQPLDGAAIVARFRPAIEALKADLGNRLGTMERADFERRRDGLVAEGVPQALAADVAALSPLATALDIVDAAEDAGREMGEVAQVYFALGGRLGLDWIRAQAIALAPESSWDRQAVAMLVDDSYTQQRKLVVQAFAGANGQPPLAAFEAASSAGLARVDQVMNEIRSGGAVDIARLVLANRQVARLLD